MRSGRGGEAEVWGGGGMGEDEGRGLCVCDKQWIMKVHQCQLSFILIPCL